MARFVHWCRSAFKGLMACGLLWAVTSGCDAINPSLQNQLTGNPAPAGIDSTGNVYVILNNLTPAVAALGYTYDIDIAGSNETAPETFAQSTPANSYFVIALPCPLADLTLTDLSFIASGVEIPTTDELPTAAYIPPALQCGTVILVNIVGVPPNVQVDVELYN